MSRSWRSEGSDSVLNDDVLIVVNTPKNEPVHIKPLGDLHVGSKQFNEKAFQRWLDELKPTDKIILLGDMIDNGVISGKLGHTVYDQAMMPSAQKNYICEKLEPYASQIIAATSGNHEKRNRLTDEDPLYTILCRLHCEQIYRPNICHITIRIAGGKDSQKVAGKYRPSYNIIVTHGAGGGTTGGASINRAERFLQSYENVDLLITAHTHRPMHFVVNKQMFDKSNAKLIPRSVHGVIVTSFLDYGGYAMEKMYPATGRLDQQEIILSSYKKHIDVIEGA